MGEVKEIECKNYGCDNRFKQYNSLQKFCSWKCSKQNQKPVKRKEIKPIPKMSAKRKKENAQYLKDRIDFLNKPENKMCRVFPKLNATEVHHMKGRIGTLYLDQNYWLPVSSKGHKKIEMNPIWAKENGFSLNRI